MPITGEKGRLRDLAQALGCPKVFPIHDGVGGRFSVLDPVGLFPAAVMGLDVVKLLEGAAAMNERFRAAAPGANPVLDYVAVSRLLEVRRGATIRVLSTWGKRLEAVGLWYDQLLAESLGKDGQGTTPLTVVNTRDLHSRGQQHQEGRRDKLITNVIVEQSRPAAVGHREIAVRTRTSSTSWPARRCRTFCARRWRARTRPTPKTIGPPPTCACRGWTKRRSGRSSRCSCWPRPSRAG